MNLRNGNFCSVMIVEVFETVECLDEGAFGNGLADLLYGVLALVSTD